MQASTVDFNIKAIHLSRTNISVNHKLQVQDLLYRPTVQHCKICRRTCFNAYSYTLRSLTLNYGRSLRACLTEAVSPFSFVLAVNTDIFARSCRTMLFVNFVTQTWRLQNVDEIIQFVARCLPDVISCGSAVGGSRQTSPDREATEIDCRAPPMSESAVPLKNTTLIHSAEQYPLKLFFRDGKHKHID